MPGDINLRPPRRAWSRVDELPPDGREKLDRMLNDQDTYWTYREISEALAEDGLTISPSSISRYVSRSKREQQQINLMLRQMDAMCEWMRDNPNFDMAQASLALLIGRLTTRIMNDPGLADDMESDKAVGHIIRAIRASAQIERINRAEGKATEAARAQVLEEVREAVQHDPELFDKLLAVVGKGEGGDADG